MTATSHIRMVINEIPPGEPFSSVSLLGLGTRAAIDQSLSRLVKAGELMRLARGVFVRPKENRYVGRVMPSPLSVAEAIAKSIGAKVGAHGAEALRRFGLATQVPTQAVFYTTGPSRHLKLGQMALVLQHVAARALAEQAANNRTCQGNGSQLTSQEGGGGVPEIECENARMRARAQRAPPSFDPLAYVSERFWVCPTQKWRAEQILTAGDTDCACEAGFDERSRMALRVIMARPMRSGGEIMGAMGLETLAELKQALDPLVTLRVVEPGLVLARPTDYLQSRYFVLPTRLWLAHQLLDNQKAA